MSGRTARQARQDQQRAAEAHTSAFFRRHEIGLPGGGTTVHMAPGAEPEWLRTLLDQHQTALNGPDAMACDHVADGQAGPRCVLAWHVGLIVCAPCAASGRFMPDKTTDDEFRCDGCSRVYPAGIYASVIQIMPDTVFHLGLCAGCRSTVAAARS